MLGWSADEAFRVGLEGDIEDGLTLGDELGSLPVVDSRGCKQ